MPFGGFHAVQTAVMGILIIYVLFPAEVVGVSIIFQTVSHRADGEPVGTVFGGIIGYFA